MKSPLHLPAGSVRAILAILVTLAAITCVVMKIEVPEWFVASVTAVTTSYFTTRGCEESHKTGARATVDVITGTPR